MNLFTIVPMYEIQFWINELKNNVVRLFEVLLFEGVCLFEMSEEVCNVMRSQCDCNVSVPFF